MAAHQLALCLTASLLLALLVLGLGLQLRRWQVARLWHHALYFAVTAGTLLSTALAARAGQGWGWLLLALAALLLMPRTRPGQAGHWRWALVCAGALGLGVWQVW